MTHWIEKLDFDKELSPGAANALSVCLKLSSQERITIITDNESAEISAALVCEVKKIGAPFSIFVLEEEGTRPMTDMPPRVLDELARSQVSIFACVTQIGELSSRIQMTDVVNRHRIRHGHMVNINKQIMCEGMRADFFKIDELSSRLIEKARKAKVIRATSPAGTDITAHFSSDIRWLKTSGLISPDKWGNLPGGEIFTSPMKVDGTFIVDGVVGDYLCQKYGDLKSSPLIIEIEDSRILDLSCRNHELLEEFKQYTATDENSNRVGEFAIGTNIGVKSVIGHILQDEKLPGIHIAFGHPYSEHTGQPWKSKTHIDCVGRDFDIWLDQEKVMEGGRFLI